MIIIILLIAALSFAAELPRIPGALNPGVTAANIQATVCAAGWTKTVRPPAGFTDRLKAAQMGALKLAGVPKDYEEDHRVPLELGGAPRNPANLWPQTWAGPLGAHQKDRLENAVRKDVCAGKIGLEAAQAVFLGDFWAEYHRRFAK